MLLMLQCAAAQAVTRLEDDEGQEVGAARLKADGEEGIAPNPR
jgi:hypothetical protein